MLSSRLPTALIARLLLALVPSAISPLCIGWHGVATVLPATHPVPS